MLWVLGDILLLLVPLFLTSSSLPLSCANSDQQILTWISSCSTHGAQQDWKSKISVLLLQRSRVLRGLKILNPSVHKDRTDICFLCSFWADICATVTEEIARKAGRPYHTKLSPNG